MHNMQNNMHKNSAGFIFCIFCILQYAEYHGAEYDSDMSKNMLQYAKQQAK